MRNMTVLCGFVGSLALATTAWADKGKATLVPTADMKWTDVPNMVGVKIAVAEGDPNKGASQLFLKFDKGFTAPEHHHSADHSAVVVAGTVILTVDGKETKLPPGSFFGFTGKKIHGTKCDPAADCVVAVNVRGKWDVLPEAAPKPDAKAEPKKPAK